jgi:hypothetical protein
VEVPDPAVEAGGGRQGLGWLDPDEGDELLRQLVLGEHGSVSGGVAADELAGGIKDFKGDGAFGVGGEPIVEDSAVGGVLSGGLVRGDGRVRVGAAADAPGVAGGEQNGLGLYLFQLAQGRDVVEYPERTTVRGDDEVVVLNPEVAHGCVGQVELERLPVVAVVEGEPDGGFGAGEEQPLADGVFADGVDRRVGQACGDGLPGSAAVVGAIEVGVLIVDAEAADGDVSRLVVEVRGGQLANLAPGLQAGRGDVLPVLAVVAGGPDEAVVGAGPEGVDVLVGGGEGVNCAEAG